MRLVELAAHGRLGASVIDVGAGTSTLVDALLETTEDVTVLDISSEALSAVALRLARGRCTPKQRRSSGLVSASVSRRFWFS